MLVIPKNNVLESKKQIKICFCYLLFGYLILFSSVETLADDWPQWRGPNRDGISSESISAWSGKQPKEVWRKTIGEGFSAISVVNGRAYTMDTDGTDESAWRLRLVMKFGGSDQALFTKKKWVVMDRVPHQ
jgi:hypothetical protein